MLVYKLHPLKKVKEKIVSSIKRKDRSIGNRGENLLKGNFFRQDSVGRRVPLCHSGRTLQTLRMRATLLIALSNRFRLRRIIGKIEARDADSKRKFRPTFIITSPSNTRKGY